MSEAQKTSTDCDCLIVGAGISGLALAAFLKKARPDFSVTILEAADRVGGAIRSHREKGYVAEWGAHGFLDNVQASRQLLAMSGLQKKALKAELGRFVRYICLDGRLRTIPQSPPKIAASNLLPLSAKLRVLAEVCKRPLPGNPTVSQWIRHRFGPALLPFADAVFTGTYAGDIDRLLIDCTFPDIRLLEKEHGSLIRGLVKKNRRRRQMAGTAPRRLPAMVSFPSGMEELPHALAQNTDIRFNRRALSLSRENGRWTVQTGEDAFTASSVAIALDINSCLSLLGTMDNAPKPPPPVPASRICTVAFGIPKAVHIPFGFGFLAPEKEKRFCLGALFSSHMFGGRAPEGYQLIEALVGGRRHPDRLEMDDTSIIHSAWKDLKHLLFLPDTPAYARVLRSASGIPQHEQDYLAARDYRDAMLQTHAGLAILGFGWDGIGINDMAGAAEKRCLEICGASPEKGPGEKRIYF